MFHETLLAFAKLVVVDNLAQWFSIFLFEVFRYPDR